MGEEVRTGDVVVDGSDDGASVPGRQDVLLDLHDDACLGTRFLALEDVEVHLVSVEVRVVRRADAEVEPEGLACHDPDAVGHHGHPVQRRLPVEEHYITVGELALDDVSDVEVLGLELHVGVHDLDPASVVPDDVVDTGEVVLVHVDLCVAVIEELPRGLAVVVLVALLVVLEEPLECDGSPHQERAQVLDVVLVDAYGDGELPGRCDRHSDLVDGEERIGRDDGTCAEVDTLSGQVGSETSLLSLEPLGQCLQRASGPVPRGRDSGYLVVEVRGDVILQELPQILDDQLGCSLVTVLPQPLVDTDDIDQFVGEVVLGPVVGLEPDGRPDGDRGDGQCLEDHPLGPACLRVDSQNDEVVLGDPLEPVADILGGELGLVLVLEVEGGGLVQLDLHDLRSAVGAEGVLGCELGGLLGVFVYIVRVPSELLDALEEQGTLLLLLVGEHEPAALAASALQEGLDLLDETDVDDRPREVDVTEVSGTVVGPGTACGALESALDDSHVAVHETAVDGVSLIVVGVCGDDLYRGHPPDLIGGQAGELDPVDPLGDSVGVDHLNSSS